MSRQVEELIAKELLKIGAVELNPKEPFIWASGLRSPIYTDNRLIISHPKTRNIVEQAMVDLIKSSFTDVEVIAGTATAGIPHASIIAHLLGLPLIYVRSSAKDHGKKNAIEGEFKKGAKVVMIEDLISTGGSVIQAAEAVQIAGGEVIGVTAIFDYMLKKSEEAFDKLPYSLESLTNYKTLVDIATKSPKLTNQKEILEAWYLDPVQWSEKF